MNKKLITQVQAGTHCAEVNGVSTPKRLEKLETLLRWVAPLDNMEPNGKDGFYAFDTIDKFWYREDYLPTGLTPIPLDRFFEEEDFCDDCGHDGKQCPICETYYKAKKHWPPATPEQPILPEVNILAKQLEDECREHTTTSGLRFFGTSWAQISTILEQYGYKPLPPF